ncbi:MAG: SIMPL domain-containing protein [Bacteroidales bacterium]|nr:SIMPL domain-containing protein [Bacteroidales bacterium]
MKKAIILGVAVIIAGAMLPVSVSRFKSYDRTVEVKGLCEREVMADKAILPLTFKVVGNDLSAAVLETEKNNRTIVEFLKSGGISEEEISVEAPKISDKFANEYGNNDRVYRYLCTGIVTVCTSDVEAVLSLKARLSELLKAGITLSENWENVTEFKFEALNDIKPEMIEEATANAREAARKFAKDSDSRLGKIKTASQGTFSIEDRDSNTPYIKKVRVVTYVTYYLCN